MTQATATCRRPPRRKHRNRELKIDEPRKIDEIAERLDFNKLAGLSDSELNRRFRLND